MVLLGLAVPSQGQGGVELSDSDQALIALLKSAPEANGDGSRVKVTITFQFFWPGKDFLESYFRSRRGKSSPS